MLDGEVVGQLWRNVAKARVQPQNKPLRSMQSPTFGSKLMSKIIPGTIRIGVGGWTYAPWRGAFYPEKLPQKGELEYMSRQLTSIEINGTYYGSQKPATFAKWRDEAPDGFVFSVKAPRFVMNRDVLASAGNTISRFLTSGVMELKAKLGAINWQFLPTKHFDPADFEAFLKLLPKEAAGRALRHVVEVRHQSFCSVEFISLVREHGVAVVIAGDSTYPQIADATAPFAYARIMGTAAKNKLGYPEAGLKLWAERARAWSSGAAPDGLNYIEPQRAYGKPRDVYLYVISGHKVYNPAAAKSLIERLG
jgi:uncharacterized protein YecE (DUF72 family)